jgi:type IV secretory pathway VirB2 component (pilin)
MDKIAQTVNNFVSLIQPYVWIAVVIVIIACSLTLIFGDKNEKVQNAKKIILGGLVGAFCLGACTSLAKMITDQMVF